MSDEAGSGELLIDQRAYDAGGERCVAVERTVSVTGFADPLTAVAVTGERRARVSLGG